MSAKRMKFLCDMCEEDTKTQTEVIIFVRAFLRVLVSIYVWNGETVCICVSVSVFVSKQESSVYCRKIELSCL